MKFLQLCLCLCLAAVGRPIFAQQTLTPEQRQQAADALRKALEQNPSAPAAEAKPLTPVPPPAESTPAAPVATPITPAMSVPPAAVQTSDPRTAEKIRKELEAKAKAEENTFFPAPETVTCSCEGQ